MSRKKPRLPAAARQPAVFPWAATDPAKGRHRLVTMTALVILLMAVVVGLWWTFQRELHPLPPAVNLQSIDPKVAHTLQQHFDAVRQHPRSGEAWGWLGALLRAYDFRPQACECLDRAEQLAPDNPRWPYHHGLALMISSPLEAIPKFRRAAEICGHDPEAPRFRLARLLSEQGRWDETQAALAPLIEGKPEFRPAQLLSARAAQARGDLSKAIELARGCTNDTRTARSSWALLAILYRQQGDTGAATLAAQRSANLPPDEGFGDPFEAEIVRLRSDARSLSEQAHPLLASGNLSEAAGLIDQMLQDHATDPDTWLLLGRLQFLRKDPAAAERALRRHLELSPRSAQGLFQLGLVLMGQNRFSEAAELFDQAIQQKPDFGPAFYNRGFALARSGQRREAIAAFRESLRHNPERADTYFLLADLHLQLGEKPQALKLLQEAQAINPSDPRLPLFRNRANR